MKRDLMYAAAVGGCVGSLMTLALGLVLPLAAQSEADANFDKITCQELEVLSPDSQSVAQIFAGRGGGFVRIGAVTIYGAERNGFISVYPNGGKRSIGIEATEKVGRIVVYGKDDTDDRARRIVMAVNKFGEGVVSTWGRDGKVGASMATTEHGGRVNVYGKGSSDPRAAMGVNEYGNGAVSTWDKNGYRQD